MRGLTDVGGTSTETTLFAKAMSESRCAISMSKVDPEPLNFEISGLGAIRKAA